MDDKAAQERRASRRFALQLPIVVTAPGDAVEAAAKSRDVSSHGICFYCNSPMKKESRIEFTLTLPVEVTMTEPLTVHCHGKVVRVEGEEKGRFAIAAAIDSYDFKSDDDEMGI